MHTALTPITEQNLLNIGATKDPYNEVHDIYAYVINYGPTEGTAIYVKFWHTANRINVLVQSAPWHEYIPYSGVTSIEELMTLYYLLKGIKRIS